MTKPILTGGCACGAIRYESTAAPQFSIHCQCRQCQRASGTGHASSIVLPTEALTVHGTLAFYEQAAASGNRIARGFCPTCGNPILNKTSGYPDSRYVHVASLDEPSIFKADRIVWSSEAQSWDHVNLDIPEL